MDENGQPIVAPTTLEQLMAQMETMRQHLEHVGAVAQQARETADAVVANTAAPVAADPGAADAKALGRFLKGESLKFMGNRGDQADRHEVLVWRRALAAGDASDAALIRFYEHTFPPKSNADGWYQGLKKKGQLPLAYEGPGGFKELFLKKWGPVDASGSAYNKLDNLTQTSTVEAYNNAFNNLLDQCEVNEAHSRHIYVKGLKQRIGDEVYVKWGTGATLAELMDQASELDARMHRRGMLRNVNNGPAATAGGPTPMELGAVLPAKRDRPKLSQEERERLKSQGLCFRCKIGKHLARDCPERNGGAAASGQ